MADSTYTVQTFFDTSRRRIQEAKAMLDVPRRHCDGAVTCALLAAECALKATLLHGRQATRLEDIPEDIRRRAFAGRSAHDLTALWNLLDASVQQRSTADQFAALTALKRLDRYCHRYGVQRPQREHAEKAVRSAEALVDWMEGVVA